MKAITSKQQNMVSKAYTSDTLGLLCAFADSFIRKSEELSSKGWDYNNDPVKDDCARSIRGSMDG